MTEAYEKVLKIREMMMQGEALIEPHPPEDAIPRTSSARKICSSAAAASRPANAASARWTCSAPPGRREGSSP